MSEAYRLHAVGLYRHALTIVADHGLAEDAVHGAFLAVLRSARRGADVRGWGAYLRTAVRHECYQLRRRQPRMREPEPLLEPVAPDATEEERLSIEAVLQALPPEQREVVCLKVFEGLTLHEIAERLGAKPNTVASRYRYAMDKLRVALAEKEGR